MMIAFVYQMVRILQKRYALLEALGQFILGREGEHGDQTKKRMMERFVLIMMTTIILIGIAELIQEFEVVSVLLMTIRMQA